MARSRNRRTGDCEERQDYINLDESESTLITTLILAQASPTIQATVIGIEFKKGAKEMNEE